MNRWILGITYGGHDTAAALLKDGEILAACAQERFNREKHTREFPVDAIRECLKIGGVQIRDLSAIAVGFDPFLYINETYLKPALEHRYRLEFLLNDAERIKKIAEFEKTIREQTGFEGAVEFHNHHLCHLASAYYPSGFDRCLLVSQDGVGETQTGMIAEGIDGEIHVRDASNVYPHSMGLLYSAVTFYLGWRHHCDEGILMGLASYGDARAKLPGSNRTYLEVFEEIVRETGEFGYEIDLSWIEYHKVRDTWISEKFKRTFGPKREYTDPLTAHHRNIAAALQQRLEDLSISFLQRAKKKFPQARLALAGGVSLNCSLNGKIEESRLFEELYVQPASGDDGVSIGACYLAYKQRAPEFRPAKRHDSYLGSRFTDAEIEAALRKNGLPYSRAENIYETVAQKLAEGKVVAWFQGGAEFGPRALGNRSILAKPWPESMRDYLNNEVKFREPFRPYAPAVLAEQSAEYFQIRQESPHMLIATQIRPEKKAEIPATVHVDGTCRVQTVTGETNPRFRKLLEAFHRKTGCPVLLNTSFNVKGQPMINTPEQAIDSLRTAKLDLLVMGEFYLEKAALSAVVRQTEPEAAQR